MNPFSRCSITEHEINNGLSVIVTFIVPSSMEKLPSIFPTGVGRENVPLLPEPVILPPACCMAADAFVNTSSALMVMGRENLQLIYTFLRLASG